MNTPRMSRDDWTVTTEKSERKKRQNRLNQRALRERKRKDEIRVVSGNKPYQISRWRIGQPEGQHDSKRSGPTQVSLSNTPQPSDLQRDVYAREHSTPGLEADALLSLVEQTNVVPRSYSSPPASADFPLSADHLIWLIQQNVFSALIKNKSVLASTTYLTKPAVQGPSFVIPSSQDFCDGLTLLHPIAECRVPQSLHPTPLQSSIPHTFWMNMFPWPRFRDNLIVHESIIDAAELLYDLFGDLCIYKDNGENGPDLNISNPKVDEEDTYAGRSGFIVWGEPWDTKGWEVTRDFMKKWSWLLKGCEELLEASNRWRAKRDEEPLL